jgi:para-aminobenzoate synthetase component I
VHLDERPDALRSGWWIVRATFEGRVRCYRFGSVTRAPLPAGTGDWPTGLRWTSSLDRDGYRRRVAAIRDAIAAGTVYQVNLCRMLTAELPATADPLVLAARIAERHPAPYAGVLLDGSDWVVSASPELWLRRSGDTVVSGPMKGTVAAGLDFAAKDVPENIMITDLVRNDLGRVAVPGTVRVLDLLRSEEHPGLRQLVSDVQARLRPDVGWPELFAAAFPPGSVSGAPKSTALRLIGELETAPRDVYCGAFGFVDADAGEAQLAVGIRTFFTSGGGRRLHFGTGAGITWASDPDAEWAETELKAARLVALAG